MSDESNRKIQDLEQRIEELEEHTASIPSRLAMMGVSGGVGWRFIKRANKAALPTGTDIAPALGWAISEKRYYYYEPVSDSWISCFEWE